MSIEKGIRALSSHPHPPLDTNIETLGGNSDLGFLDTSQRHGKKLILHLQDKSGPEGLTLRARIVPIPRDKKSVSFQISVNGSASPKSNFYGKKALEENQQGHTDYSQFKAVDLLYTGQGTFLRKGESLPLSMADFQISLTSGNTFLQAEDCLLRKKFLVQNRSHLFQRQTYVDDGQWLVTPPYGNARINSYPLIAYGGYIKPGLPLNRISQIFAVPTRRRERDPAKLHLRSQRDLELNRVPPPQPGYLNGVSHHYIDAFQKSDLLSLLGHIETGLSQLCLLLREGDEEENKEVNKEVSKEEKTYATDGLKKIYYKSYGYTQSDPASGLIDINFKPIAGF